MNDTQMNIPDVHVVTLLVPGVGRVLALRTNQRTQTSSILLADLGGQSVYLNDIGTDGQSPAQYDLQVLGSLATWMQRPEIAPAVAAALAHDPDGLEAHGPLTFARAVQHIAVNLCSAAEGLMHAIATAKACADSEAHTDDEVRRLMGAGAPA